MKKIETFPFEVKNKKNIFYDYSLIRELIIKFKKKLSSCLKITDRLFQISVSSNFSQYHQHSVRYIFNFPSIKYNHILK